MYCCVEWLVFNIPLKLQQIIKKKQLLSVYATYNIFAYCLYTLPTTFLQQFFQQFHVCARISTTITLQKNVAVSCEGL